jgi:nitrite reductase/ring-hydroxylating ferredoxin subunit
MLPPAGTPLCRLDALAETDSRGFSFGSGAERCEVFLVRKAGRLHAYVNQCPHVGTPLDWREDHFLNLERTLILCATHGALFRIEDGYCVAGPCLGKRLRPVALEIEQGEIRIGRSVPE